MKPQIIIPTGIGINGHAELGQAFKNAGADVSYTLIKNLVANPDVLDKYQGLGLPGGFMMGDQLGAGQSTRNRIYDSALKDKLEEKLADKNFPTYIVCNSLQLLAKLNLFPIDVGTTKNESGKHETTSWDMAINENNETVWLNYLKRYPGPIFAPISHGEGRIIVPEIELAAELIALKYTQGHMSDYFSSSRGERYNPNGSNADIAGFGWNNNLVLFPHFERLIKNLQREDKALLQTKQIQPKYIDSTPDGLFEPTYQMFKAAVDFMKEN